MRVSDLDGIQGSVPSSAARKFLLSVGARIKHQRYWGEWRRQVGLVDGDGATKVKTLTQRQFFLLLIRLRYSELCAIHGVPAREHKDINVFHLEDLGNLWFEAYPGSAPDDVIMQILKDQGGAVPANMIGDVIEAWTGKKWSKSTIYRRQRKAKIKSSQSRKRKLSIAQIHRLSII